MSESQALQNSQRENSPKTEVSKQTIRKQVWDHLDKNKIACFHSPFGRIPNFKGAEQAAAKLLELDEFKSAKSVEVNPDKPLQPSRIIVLENDKELFVPVPGLQESLLKKLKLQEGINVKRIVSRWGIENTGDKIDISDKIHVDLFVLGSVAVSKDGYRIGKGRGYADLEFAILKEMNAVDDKTVIVTTVHDSQVFDELPKDLFKKYDVPIDYILTPTKIIKIENILPRPEGIYWNLLSQKRLNSMEILQKLKKKHESEGRTVVLKDVDADVENFPPKKFYKNKKSNKKLPKKESGTSDAEQNTLTDDTQMGKSEVRGQGRRRYFRTRPSKTEEVKSNKENGTSENSENIPPPKRRRKNRKFHIDFSLLVTNIERNVRVRDLKNALKEKGVKPYSITWKGFRGICYLHYAMKNNKKAEEDQHKPFAIDNVIEILQGLKITPDCKRNLNVKVMEPITRIETTDVTAV